LVRVESNPDTRVGAIREASVGSEETQARTTELFNAQKVTVTALRVVTETAKPRQQKPLAWAYYPSRR
jgi:hypothetical protein